MREVVFLTHQNHARDAVEVLKHLKSFEQNFTFTATSQSLRIDYLDETYFFVEQVLSMKALNLINHLRKEVALRMKDVELKSRDDVKFYQFKRLKEQTRYIEYDLTAAYAHALYELKLCSDETYCKLLELKKSERLAAVGALATKKFIEVYERGELVSSSKHEEETEPAWWTVCHHVDRIMQEYLDQHSEGMYWVDAILVPCEIELSREHKKREVVVTSLGGGTEVRLNDGRRFCFPQNWLK